MDLAKLRRVTDAVAVMLIAEMQRCFHYAQGRLVAGSYPERGTEAYEVLGGLGISKLLNLPEPDLDDATRSWFQIRSGCFTEGETIDRLLKHFAPHLMDVVVVDRQWEGKFYRALMDATTNTLEHAYLRASRRPWLPRRWWAAGMVDKNEGTVRFIFWDQGLGIPKTIRRRLRDVLTPDGDLIARAVEAGSSRIRSRRRGHGLYALIELSTWRRPVTFTS